MKEDLSKEHAPRPALLDIVKLDGRWAQVIVGGGYVNYLSENQVREIEWNEYTFKKRWGLSVDTLIELGQSFTQKEVDNIHWGPEEIQHPQLKRQVTVFGEYQSKK